MDARQQIESSWKGFIESWRSNDPAGAASWYTTDAINMPPGAPDVRGREQIERLFQDAAQLQDVQDFSHRTAELEVHDDTAYELGQFSQTVRPRDGGELVVEEARYLAIWKQEGDDSWKLHRFLWASLPMREP